MTTRKTKANGSPTAGQRVMARGAEVDLGGTMVRLRMDWDAVELLEERWGSLRAWGETLQKSDRGPMFKAVGDGVAACARDLPVPAKSLMDLGRLGEYADALIAAAIEGGLWSEDADQGNPTGPTTAPSPGNGSSGSTLSTGTSTPSGGDA